MQGCMVDLRNFIEQIKTYQTGHMKEVEFFQHWSQQATAYPSSTQGLVDHIQV